MAHDWHDTRPNTPLRLMQDPFRKCANCGAEQWQRTEHLWMRIVSRRWEPLAGRCKGKMSGSGEDVTQMLDKIKRANGWDELFRRSEFLPKELPTLDLLIARRDVVYVDASEAQGYKIKGARPEGGRWR